MTTPERVFTLADQHRFAALSGDRNPLHVDPDWAATVYPGRVVVHGMHLVLGLLDQVVDGRGLARLAVTFVRPVLLGDRLETKVTPTEGGLVVMVLARDEVMARLDLVFGPPAAEAEPPPAGVLPSAPRALSPAEMTDRGGEMALPAAAPLAEAFPRLARAVGGAALAGLAGLSTLVGMECPGLHSVFADLAVTFAGKSDGTLRYRVTQLDRRFSRVTLAVEGGGLAGTVAASAGAPEAPEEDEDVAGLVAPGEFAGQTPLVVGGGSGLGATTARLLAAGGAEPVVTGHRSVGQVRLDVTDPAAGLAELVRLGWSGGQVYYFASPRIFRRRLEPYQAEDFADFAAVYVDGFYELMRGLTKLRPAAPLTVFYPSSVAVAKPPADMLEYALAKQAGEGLCAALERKFPRLRMVVERLPRIDSRQTRSFVKVAAAKPVSVMLPIIRRVQGMGS